MTALGNGYHFFVPQKDHIASERAAKFNEDFVQGNRRGNRQLEELNDRIDRLTLLCESMWHLIEHHTDLTTEDLERHVDEMDRADGQRDRRRQRTAVPCECGAMVPVASLGCQFCGAPVRHGSIFDAV